MVYLKKVTVDPGLHYSLKGPSAYLAPSLIASGLEGTKTWSHVLYGNLKNFSTQKLGAILNWCFEPLKGVVDMLDVGGENRRIGEHPSSSKLVFVTQKKNYICKPVWTHPPHCRQDRL